MTKTFCDRCGEEITGTLLCVIEVRHVSEDQEQRVACYTLCLACWRLIQSFVEQKATGMKKAKT